MLTIILSELWQNPLQTTNMIESCLIYDPVIDAALGRSLERLRTP